MTEEFEKIQIELNNLTETSEKINNCQNKLQKFEADLKSKHDSDKKCLLDLRLQYGKKIEEANQYYKAVCDVDNEKFKSNLLHKQLFQTQEILSNSLSEITPDISNNKSNEIKSIREKINQIKLDIQVSSVNIKSKNDIASNLLKKYQRSINISKNYFLIKDQSVKNTKIMIELINKFRDEMNRLRHDYSTHMYNLEKISCDIHLQRSTQKMVDSRLNEQLTESDLSSIGSFNFDDEDDLTQSANNSDLFTNATPSSNLTHSHNHLNHSLSSFAQDSNLPSPCRSINLPLNHKSGSVVSRETNISWHPLL